MNSIWTTRVLIIWASIVIGGLAMSWPAAKLIQPPLPSYPKLEECQGTPFDKCFANVVRQRMVLLSDQEEFVESFPWRIAENIGYGAAIWGSGVVLICWYRRTNKGKPVKGIH